ncbi:hypothetical protein EHQ16_09530 [Leptospira kanakyensis]|uniref:Outer membrane protein beta-barrel domain-containing protein n=1 Tax=Leptospira kanakyensis TaxID=2484968 RepID=A0A6N4PW32_9LEPT|nr:LA_2444/LA_4059 family outer membrane protein [Leptospira kanakyensis]TGK49456.1 hypothetical protein EHQ11_15660 [Leptospira kanakyensis]TGK60304.1 hypothetical protein EHQ16_09530 [Leptospira kanakyensis]TGK67703.1 hypothetical protein EHQ18_14330 [Leptospira kanakyensis]
MKKIIKTTILILILLNSALISQSTKPTIETGIKAQKAEFIPFDYSRSVSDAIPIWLVNVHNLRNNSKTITPFFFIYKNLEKGFAVEFEYTKIQLERANFDSEIYTNPQIRRFKNYLTNNERSDFKLNFLFFPSQQLNEYFSFGLGIRKIDRLRNASVQNYSLEEKIIAHGPQIVMKSKIPLTDQLSINLGLDLYHTQGRRTYNYSAQYYYSFDNFSYIETVKDNGKTIGVFQGYEANVSLKYNFLENYNLAFGYNYNYAYFKYENLGDSIYYASSESKTIQQQNTKFSNGKEIIRGFYISASTVF